MPVFQEQGSDGYRFSIRPSCALSWRVTKLVVLFFSGCLAVVGVYFAALGAWIVLPFAGLELVVLAAGFYLSALASHTREVVEIEGPVPRVLRGRRQLREVAGLPANWARVELRRVPGAGIPVVSFCVVTARALRSARSWWRRNVRSWPSPSRLAPSAPGKVAAEMAQARTRQVVGGVAGSDPMSGAALGPDGASAAGCARGAYPNK